MIKADPSSEGLGLDSAFPPCVSNTIALDHLAWHRRRPCALRALAVVQGGFPGGEPPWLVVPVVRTCQSPMWTWLVNYLHSHLHLHQTDRGETPSRGMKSEPWHGCCVRVSSAYVPSHQARTKSVAIGETCGNSLCGPRSCFIDYVL